MTPDPGLRRIKIKFCTHLIVQATPFAHHPDAFPLVRNNHDRPGASHRSYVRNTSQGRTNSYMHHDKERQRPSNRAQLTIYPSAPSLLIRWRALRLSSAHTTRKTSRPRILTCATRELLSHRKCMDSFKQRTTNYLTLAPSHNPMRDADSLSTPDSRLGVSGGAISRLQQILILFT